MSTCNAKNKGFTLLEVLISMVVLSIGLLGLFGLQTTSLKFSHSSYQRTQATNLAYSLLDRARVNRSLALSTTAYNLPVGSIPPSATDCNSNSCDPNGLAAHDLFEWYTEVTNTLPDAQAGVAINDLPGGARLYVITITWPDLVWDDATKSLDRGNTQVIVRSEI